MEAISKEGYKVVVTEKAAKVVAKQFQGRKKRPMRLFVKLGGCGIRSFSIALEKPLPTDDVFTIDGFEYFIDKKLFAQVHPVIVDSDNYGLRISGSGVPPFHGCGNCGFLCGDGSRCSGDCATCTHKCAHGLRKLKAQKKKD